MSRCDENCRDCVFHTTLSFYGIICNYLGVMGRRRGCPPGKDCLRKIRGPKRESLDSRLYKMPPSSSSSGMPGIGPKAQYPNDSGGTSSPNRSSGSDLGTKDAEDEKAAPAGGTGVPSSAPSGHGGSTRPPQSGGSPRAEFPPGEGKDAEEAARIAEKKRKKAEQHRAWVARNREHLREYQQERRRKAKEAAERGTGVPSSVPSGQIPPGEANETL
jgi:hypothetical protein